MPEETLDSRLKRVILVDSTGSSEIPERLRSKGYHVFKVDESKDSTIDEQIDNIESAIGDGRSDNILWDLLDRKFYTDKDKVRITSIVEDIEQIKVNREFSGRFKNIADNQAEISLMGIIDNYCPFILNHIDYGIKHISDMCRRLDLHRDKSNDIRKGYIFHDVGKLFIPESILKKKKKLSPEEKEIVHLHPEDSYKILSYFGWVGPAKIVRHHHASPGGQGYPKIKKVCIGPQLISIVDSFFGPQQKTPYRDEALPGVAYTQFIEKAIDGKFYVDIARIYDDILRRDDPNIRRRKSYSTEFQGMIYRGKNGNS